MKLVLKNVRLAFPKIWVPEPYEPGSPPRCTANFIIHKDDPQVVLIQEVLRKVAIETWKDQARATLDVLRGKDDLCFHDGATKSKHDGFAGNMFISASNKVKPTVVAKLRFNGKPVEVNEAGATSVDGRVVRVPFAVKAPYGGCFVNASLDIWGQVKKGTRINAKLLAIQFEADGAAFGGGEGFASADFDDTSVEAGAEEAFGFDDADTKVTDADVPW